MIYDLRFQIYDGARAADLSIANLKSEIENHLLALVTDLIFATKITSTAKSLGVEVKTVRSLEKLDERLASGGGKTVLIDLNADGVDVLEAIRRCRAANPPPRIIAFVSHLQAELIEAARQAGADEVMARSAFVNKLPAILMEGEQL